MYNFLLTSISAISHWSTIGGKFEEIIGRNVAYHKSMITKFELKDLVPVEC